MRDVTSAKPPKNGKLLPVVVSTNVDENVRAAVIVEPFSVTLMSAVDPDPPQ